MKLISAVVRFPADEVRTSAQGRQYISALFADDAGQQHRVFGPPTFEPLRRLQPGQRVHLAEDAKGRLHLVEPDQGDQPSAPMGFTPPASAPQVHQQQAPQYVAQHPAPAAPAPDPILQLASQWAAAYHHLIALGVDPSAAPAAASTCLIQTGRR